MVSTGGGGGVAGSEGEVTLSELREVFRKDMAAHDYCIGQDRVEALFRRLLGEPDPAPKATGKGVSAQQVAEARELAFKDTSGLMRSMAEAEFNWLAREMEREK